MSIVNPIIAECMGKASWIRRVYELGGQLRAKYGDRNVRDFSLGNPHLEPPVDLVDRLRDLVSAPEPGMHRYMTSAGFPAVRKKIAAAVTLRERTPVGFENILMTCGAAGAINVAFRTLIAAGDEVVLFTPCFAEYRFYCLHAGATPRTVATTKDFDLDADAFAASIDARTRLVLINSPNNPTGRVYSPAAVAAVVQVLIEKSRQFGRPIILLADDPYRRILYDDVKIPPLFPLYPATLIATSFSKDLGLAGERIGYLAMHPQFPDAEQVFEGLCFCMRTLGFVNAPALMQLLVGGVQDASVDVDAYRRNRDLLVGGLTKIGYRVRNPDGAFFAFPEAPGGDDVAFMQRLLDERILAVPGVGFDAPGYFRLSFAAPESEIEAALPGFKRAFDAFRT